MSTLKPSHRYTLLTSICALILSSCNSDSKITTNTLSNELVGTTAAAGALELSITVIDDVEGALLKEGMTTEQAAVIRTGALSGLESARQASLSLAQTKDSGYKLHLTVPAIMGGAITAMKDPATGLSASSAKLQMSKVMTNAVFSSMKTKMASIDTSFRESMPGSVAKAAVSKLDDAGLSGDELSSGIGLISEATVASLSGIGYRSNELLGVVTSISEQTVSGMSETGISADSVNAAMGVFVAKAVGALDESGVKPEEVSSFVGPIMSGAVGGLDEMGLSGASQMQSVVGDLMASAVTALSHAGVKEASHISLVLNKAVHGTMEGIGKAGISSSSMSYFVDDMMKGAVMSLDDIGVKDAASIESLAGSASADVISYLDDFGIKDQSAIKTASEAIATGTMNALGDLSDEGLFDKAAMQSAAAFVSQRAVDALYVETKALGMVDGVTDIASGFATGMVAGLSEAGWKTADISTVSDDIGSGFQKALQDEDFDQSSLSDLTASIETSANSWVSNMEIHCSQEKGTWHADGWCEYPKLAPASGTSGPSSEEKDRCFADGGAIKYLADGGYFCDISEGGSDVLSDPASCRERGYMWAKDPKGHEYCETGTLPSVCWSYLDSSACGVDGACSWLQNHCEASQFISCDSYSYDASICNNQNTCFFDNHNNNCVTDFCAIDANSVECAGSSGTSHANISAHLTGLPPFRSSQTGLHVQVSGAGIVSYKYNVVGSADSCTSGSPSSWTSVNTAINHPLGGDGHYKLCVIGRDAEGKSQSVPTEHTWVKDTLPPAAITLLNAPQGVSGAGRLDVQVGGADVSHYRYKLGSSGIDCSQGAGYSQEFAKNQRIVDSLLYFGDGTIKLCVQGRDIAGNIQPLGSAFIHTWTYSTVGWEFDITTSAGNETMKIGFVSPEDIIVDWGDGNVEFVNTSFVTHAYAGAGSYVLTIRGKAERIHFNNPEAQSVLTGIRTKVQGISGLTSFHKSFEGHSSLSSLPANLFEGAPLATDFSYVFAGTYVASIPGDIFTHNTQATDFSFAFYNNSVLSAIPPGLFDNNIAATNFRGTFKYASSLSSVPAELFDNNTNVQSFALTFYQAASITQVPELWVTHPSVSDSSSCFTGVNSATNSGSIPAYWK